MAGSDSETPLRVASTQPLRHASRLPSFGAHGRTAPSLSIRASVLSCSPFPRPPPQILPAAVAADDSLVCDACGNNDPLLFVEDSRAGELTCRQCGRVASQRRTLDGDWTRGSLAEDGDRTQQGPPQQRNYSSQWNLRTAFSAPLGVSKAELAHMRRMAAAMERGQESANVSTGQRTTAAYKDKMKSTAFAAMDAAGERLGLHRAVTDAAKDLFTRLRDQRENMHRFKTVILACLAISCARAGISAFDSALEKSEQASGSSCGAAAAAADVAAAARLARGGGEVMAPSAASAMPSFLPDTDLSLDAETRRRAAAAMRSAEAETSRKHRLSVKPRFFAMTSLPERRSAGSAAAAAASDAAAAGGAAASWESVGRAEKRTREVQDDGEVDRGSATDLPAGGLADTVYSSWPMIPGEPGPVIPGEPGLGQGQDGPAIPTAAAAQAAKQAPAAPQASSSGRLKAMAARAAALQHRLRKRPKRRV